MPNIKSAKKLRARYRQENCSQQGSQFRSEDGNQEGQPGCGKNNADNKAEAIRVAIKKIDQAAAKGIMHKNTAARKKSALAKKLNEA